MILFLIYYYWRRFLNLFWIKIIACIIYIRHQQIWAVEVDEKLQLELRNAPVLGVVLVVGLSQGIRARDH
jgi:hypothetical protein